MKQEYIPENNKVLAACIETEVKQGKFGLVSRFHVAELFRDAATKVHSEIGYWKFDGCSPDTQGEFVPLEQDKLCKKEHARLKMIWDQQVKHVQEENEKRRTKMAEVFPDELFDGKSPKNDDPVPPGSDGSGQHSMVLLGTYKDSKKNFFGRGRKKEQVYFMLLNWWRRMPLVLVSVEYLRSCQATVYFLKESLIDRTDQFDRTDRFLGEWDFPDGGDDEHEAGPCRFDYDSVNEGQA